MDDQMLIKVILDVGMQGGNVKDVVKQFDELTKVQQNQGKIAKETALADSMALADRLKLKTQMKSLAMDELKSDQDMLKSKATLSKANTDITKSVKELSKEMLHQEKVTRAMGEANSYVEKTFAGVAKGALTLADAEQKLTQNAKAVAQEIMSLKKEMEASGKATADQVAKLKQLETALDTYKEAADEAGDAQLEFNRMMQNADERLAGNAKAVGMFGASLAGLSGTIGGAGGLLADFAGSAANAANQFGGMMDQLKAGKDMKGFQGMMTQATAAVGMAQVGIQAVMQIYTMIDGAIRKAEQATIDAGKNAQKQMGEISNYKLSNKSLDDTLNLVKTISEGNQKLGDTLRAVSMDSEKFEAALNKANAKLRETKELGLAMEWKTGQTGGGLLGWLKDTTGDLQQWSIEVGKALASLDEIRQKAAEADKAYSSAMSTSSGAIESAKSKLLDLDISIAKARKNQAEVDRLEIQKIQDEGQKLLDNLAKQKETITKLLMDTGTEARKLALQQAEALRTLEQDLNKGSTIETVALRSTLGFTTSKEDITKFTNTLKINMDAVIKANMDAIRIGEMGLESLDKNGKHVAGVIEKVFDQMAKSADPKRIQFAIDLYNSQMEQYGVTVSTFGELAAKKLDDNDIKGFMSSLMVTMPALSETIDLVGKYNKQLKDIGVNYEIMKGDIEKIIAKTKELWALERKDDKKPTTKPTVVVDNYNFKDVLANLDAIEKRVNGFTLPMIEEMKLTLAKRLYELTKTPDEQGKYSEEIIKLSKVMTLLQGQFNSVEKQLYDMKAGIIDSFTAADTRLKRMMMGWTGEAIPDANAKLKALDAQVDQQIDAIEEYYEAQGKLGDQQLKYFEKMRNDMKEVNRQTVAYEGTLERAAEEQKKLNEETAKLKEIWNGVKSVIAEAQKDHEEWLKIFDPAAYAKLIDDKRLQAVQDKIGNYAVTMGNVITNIGKMTSKEVAYWEELLGIKFNAADGWQDEINAITAFFQKAIDEANDLANKTGDTTKNLKDGKDAAKDLAQEIKTLSENAGKVDIKFDLDGFLKEFDAALNGAPIQNIFEKLSDKYTDAIDKINKEYIDKGNEAKNIYLKALADAGGLGNPNLTDKQKQDQLQAKRDYLEGIAKLDAEYAQKRIENAKNTALEVANAYRTELEKLEQMQKSFDDRIKSREKMTGDARIDVANYVSRSKMSKAQQEADDIAKGIADQYQKYLAAGMSELELTEWLALKKKEALTGKDAETTKWFEKQWGERSKAAIESARIEKELYDAETKRMQDAIGKQTELVDNLKKLADEAKNALIAMLEQVGITADKISQQPGSSAGSTGSSQSGSQPTFKLVEGMLYSQVKGSLSDSQKPSPAMIAEIGVAGVTDLEYRSGAWARYRKQTTAADTGKPVDKPTPKGEAVPLETSAEIQARIENYNKLGETAKTVITNIKGYVVEYDKAMQESFKLLQPVMTEQWVKDLVASIAKLGKAMVDAFKEPFTKEFDPINGTGLVRIIAEWGTTLIQNYAAGIDSGKKYLGDTVVRVVAEAVAKYLETHSPPKEGPLHEIDIWGYQTGQLYTQSFGQGITDGNIYINTGLSETADTVQKVSKKITNEYAPKNLGMATMIGTSDLTALKDVLKQLTADPTVKGMWSAREKQYASSDQEFGAFSKALDLQVNKTDIEKQTADLNATDTASKVEQFYKQFNKGLLSPDMGDISEELVRKQIQDQPYLSSFYWYGKQLQQQYPEIYKNLIADGTLTPATTGEIKNKKGEIIGRSQTGSYRDRYSVDYQEQDYAGATGFNDWLQSNFNEWLVKNQNMVDPDTGKTIGSSGYNPTLARDKFLGGWSDERLSDIMTQYQNYVKGLNTVKSVQDYEKEIMEKYSGTSIAKALASGQDIDKTLVNSDWGNTLLTNKQKAQYQDKTIKTGSGIFDSKGIRQEGLEVLAGMNKAKGGVGSGGLGSAGYVGALIKASGSYVITSKDNSIIFTIPREDTLPPQDFDYDELGINDIMKLFEVDYKTAEDMWKKNKHYKINFAGKKTQGLMGGMGGFAASGNVAKLPDGYTVKDIFATVKGNYAGGVDALAKMAGDMNSDKRKLILDSLEARIDAQYPNVSTTRDQSQIGGGVVSGDYIKVNATETQDYTATRSMLKDKVAQMLGFDKEFSVARGWRNAEGADVDNTANEEILKWVELTSDEIRKMTPGIDDPIVESENYQRTREYLQDIIADKGVTPDLLKDFQTALNAAMSLGYIDKSEAAKLVSTLLPSGVDIKEQVGLTTFRGGTKEIEGFSWIDALLQSPWGGQSPDQYGQEGMRQLLEKYTDLAPVVTSKTGSYSNQYKITDNAFKYYERASKGYQPGYSWTDLNNLPIPDVRGEPMPYESGSFGGGYPIGFDGGMGGFGSYGSYGDYGNFSSPMVPGVNMGTGNRVSTFSSGSGNTFYFSVNIAKMDVENGEDFGDQFIETITDKMRNIGVTI